jgi:hypothetical protein
MTERTLLPFAAILISFPAWAQVQTGPAKASVPATPSLVTDDVWGQPLRYIDFVLERAAERCRPQVEDLMSSKEMFRARPYGSSPATVNGLINPANGRALLSVQHSTVKILRPVREVCEVVFIGFDMTLGARSDEEGRYNLLSWLLPPSASQLTRETRVAANARLIEQLDYRVQIFEAETGRVHTCLRPAASDAISVSVEEPSTKRGKR